MRTATTEMSQALVEQSAAVNKVHESWYNIRNPPKPLSLKGRATAAALAACEAEKEAEHERAELNNEIAELDEISDEEEREAAAEAIEHHRDMVKALEDVCEVVTACGLARWLALCVQTAYFCRAYKLPY